jgi:hypothetical protein
MIKVVYGQFKPGAYKYFYFITIMQNQYYTY